MITDLNAHAMTDPGRERTVNEDRAWEQVYSASEGEPTGLFIICDGMGGSLAGEVASHWAVETIKKELADFFCQTDPRATVRLSPQEIEAAVSGTSITRQTAVSEMERRVRAAIDQANRVVRGYARQKPKQAGDCGTTASLALVKGELAVIANVGDSRTYRLRDHKLQQITRDHSLVAGLVASGQIQREAVFHHPQRNVIYRSLGQKSQVQTDIFLEILRPGDHLLLCSDGLWEMLPDERLMAQLIENAGEPRQACERLIRAANAAGGEDNIGVVVVKAS